MLDARTPLKLFSPTSEPLSKQGKLIDAYVKRKRLGRLLGSLRDLKNGVLTFSLEGKVVERRKEAGELTCDRYRVEAEIRLGEKGIAGALVQPGEAKKRSKGE